MRSTDYFFICTMKVNDIHVIKNIHAYFYARSVKV